MKDRGSVRCAGHRAAFRKKNYAAEDWFDLWYPDLAPSADLMARGKAAQSDRDWSSFEKAFRAEMGEAAPRRTLDLLALFVARRGFFRRLLLRE